MACGWSLTVTSLIRGFTGKNFQVEDNIDSLTFITVMYIGKWCQGNGKEMAAPLISTGEIKIPLAEKNISVL